MKPENLQQVVGYLVNHTHCKDERNAKAAISKACKNAINAETIRVYKTRFQVLDGKLWIYKWDKKS